MQNWIFGWSFHWFSVLVPVVGKRRIPERTSQTSTCALNQIPHVGIATVAFLLYHFQLPSGLTVALLGFSPRAKSGQKGIRPRVHLQKAAPSAALPQQPAVVVVPSKHRDMIRERRKKIASRL